jgi:hypothetical protein
VSPAVPAPVESPRIDTPTSTSLIAFILTSLKELKEKAYKMD